MELESMFEIIIFRASMPKTIFYLTTLSLIKEFFFERKKIVENYNKGYFESLKMIFSIYTEDLFQTSFMIYIIS